MSIVSSVRFRRESGCVHDGVGHREYQGGRGGKGGGDSESKCMKMDGVSG